MSLLRSILPYPPYAYSDHLPLKCMGTEMQKRPVSVFKLEQLSDIAWVHSYIPGHQNTLYDGLNRYPLLGPRVLTPIGITQAVTKLFDYLPDSFRDLPKLCIFDPPHTQRLAQQMQAWRRPTNSIDTHSITHRSPPPSDTSLVLATPPPEDAPHIAARLQTDLTTQYVQGGKLMFLDSDQLWFIDNISELQRFSKIYAQVLQRPAPLLDHFAASRK
jgi:hypothetical protein